MKNYETGDTPYSIHITFPGREKDYTNDFFYSYDFSSIVVSAGRKNWSCSQFLLGVGTGLFIDTCDQARACISNSRHPLIIIGELHAS